MTVYLKKTWGFSEPCGPLQFSEKGARDKAMQKINVGDLVVIVGTKGVETPSGHQGKILGLMESSKISVSATDYVSSSNPILYDKNGKYKWPYGLELRNAWRFDHPLQTLASHTDTIKGRMGAPTIVPLEDDVAQAILSLPKTKVDLLQPARVSARVLGKAGRGGRTAPPPSTSRSGVMHMRQASAYTYAMRLFGATGPAFKIGWAFDYDLRQRQFNRASIPELGGIRYQTKLHELWDTARQAFRMEQRILHHFSSLRSLLNNEVIGPIDPENLESEWRRIAIEVRRESEK